MKVELRDLMDDNEMLSHIFLGCMKQEELREIRETYTKDIDWKKESVKLLVEMTIAGISVNPKEFFETWKDQMQQIIVREAKKLVSAKLGSAKMSEMMNKISEYEQILESWESEINWDVKNPLI